MCFKQSFFSPEALSSSVFYSVRFGMEFYLVEFSSVLFLCVCVGAARVLYRCLNLNCHKSFILLLNLLRDSIVWLTFCGGFLWFSIHLSVSVLFLFAIHFCLGSFLFWLLFMPTEWAHWATALLNATALFAFFYILTATSLVWIFLFLPFYWCHKGHCKRIAIHVHCFSQQTFW